NPTLYRVVSDEIKSDVFPCFAAPKQGQPLKILLTSDYQLKPMVAANIQKIAETVPKIDAIFFAGDCVNIPDEASEWFDDSNNLSFFPCLQGKTSHVLNGVTYSGSALIQSAPLFPAVGNHEVMGRLHNSKSLLDQFKEPFPLKKNHDDAFNTISYEEIFSFPDTCKSKKYYSVIFGDVYLIVLCAARAWRKPHDYDRGKYANSKDGIEGGGDFIYEDIAKGSDQYQWLENELNSSEFKNSKYKLVMLHNAFHTLGENALPPFAHPIRKETENKMFYDYPIKDDILIRDIEPLLIQHGVHLVHSGHSHIWCRFKHPSKMNYLETSNSGNSYGSYLKKDHPCVPKKELEHVLNMDNYKLRGDPNGLKPVLPSLNPLIDEDGVPMPYIASNRYTVFSIFDTKSETIDSYYFDTENPNNPVIHFDQFSVL
ncbi:MAG: metallophosphoesterase, partial [Parachlamydiales bacterium]|nr:metallophosphoesterase [Parachlamydiales bacterium]